MNLNKARATANRMPIWLQQAFDRLVATLAILLGWQLDSVANVAGLTAVDDTDVPDGTSKVVRSVWDTFTLDKTDTTSVVDGITVVATASGTGRWLRDEQPVSTLWVDQTTWYVDGTAGDDENDGLTSGTAIASMAELVRRVGRYPNYEQQVTINVLSSVPNDDTASFNPTGVRVAIVGVPTTVYQGELTGYTSLNVAGNVNEDITDAAWEPSNYVRSHIIEFTDNAAAGLRTFIFAAAAGVGATADILPVVDVPGYSLVDPGIGDHFDVKELPVVRFRDISNVNASLVNVSSPNNADWDELYVFDCLFVNCLFDGMDQLSVMGESVLQTSCINEYTTQDGNAYYRNMLLPGFHVNVSAYTEIDRWSVIVMAGGYMWVQGSVFSDYPLGLYDSGVYAFYVPDGGSINLSNIYGTTTSNTTQIVVTELGDAYFSGTSYFSHLASSLLSYRGYEMQTLEERANFHEVRVVRTTFVEGDLTDADTSQTLNLGDALPAGSRIIGVDMNTLTPFTGGALSAFTVDIGSSADADAIIDGADVHNAAVDGGPVAMPQGIRPNKYFAASTQLTAKFDSVGANVADATAGAVTIDVYYTVWGA